LLYWKQRISNEGYCINIFLIHSYNVGSEILASDFVCLECVTKD